jgi:hypothetical protein
MAPLESLIQDLYETDPGGQAGFRNTLGYGRKLEMAVTDGTERTNAKIKRPTPV